MVPSSRATANDPELTVRMNTVKASVETRIAKLLPDAIIQRRLGFPKPLFWRSSESVYHPIT